MEGLAKIGGPLIAIGLIGYGIYHWLSEHPTVLPFTILAIVVIVGSFFLFMKLSDDRAEARIYEGMPVEGPVKVNLRIEQIHERKHRLHIDIKMTRRDWEALKATGLTNHTLFSYQHPKFEDAQQHYSLGLSLRVKHADFTNSMDAHDAKEECIRSLQAVRSRIEQQHTFVARPAEQVESLEI